LREVKAQLADIDAFLAGGMPVGTAEVPLIPRLKQLVELRVEIERLQAEVADEERWMREVLTDFRIPFDDHKQGRRAAIVCWMQGVKTRADRLQERVKESADVIGGFPYADPNCKGCGKPLVLENSWMTDGCPCNSALGTNSMNETRWRLLMQLQQ
jgi:hypothetical protein